MILVLIGFFYRIFEMFEMERRGIDSEWLPLVLFFLLVVEVYLALLYFWCRNISQKRIHHVLKFIQLFLILIFGIIPGLLALYPAFFKT